jgi:exodeoxyribonuclease VII large subunit
MGRRDERGGGEEQLGFDMAPVLPRRRIATESGAGESPVSQAEVPRTPEHPATVPDSPSVLSVGQLTRRITSLLEEGIGTLWVEGEISNLRRQPSGHCYFTLKDAESQLSCVLFARSASAGLHGELRDGQQVQVFGQVTVYQQRGQYQMIVRVVQPKGEGALQARFEELKRRLSAEGLFDQSRKRPLPRFPLRIGVVTSTMGAAIHDFLNVLHRRNPSLRVVISPVRVQGRGAATEIAAAITELSTGAPSIGFVDVIVVTRGGGSLEDLWEFNEELVARAIVASHVPVLSAVGHEIDFSIADFAADLRAATPSAAAEILAADGSEVLERCRTLVTGIGREAQVVAERHHFRERRLEESALFREPLRRIDDARQNSDRLEEFFTDRLDRRMEQVASGLTTVSARLEGLNPSGILERMSEKAGVFRERLSFHLTLRLDREKGRLQGAHSALAALSPAATLARGFTITRNAEGRVISSAREASPGDRIRTQLADGEIVSVVEAGDLKPEV